MVAGVAALVLGLLCVGVWAAVKGRVRDQLCDRARYCDGEHYYCRRACAEWNGMVMINFILLAVLFTPLHLIFVGAYARGFFGYHAQAPGARLPRLCAWAAREPLAALVHAVAYACCLVALFALLRPMLATYGNPTWNHVVLYTSSGGGSKVEKVVVQGAGGPNFNTIYYPVGNADGVPMYGGEKGGGTSTLRREGGMWVAKGHAGVTRYQCKSDAAQPPETVGNPWAGDRRQRCKLYYSRAVPRAAAVPPLAGRAPRRLRRNPGRRAAGSRKRSTARRASSW